MISVVVPHLNQPDGLKRCLQSLNAQTVDRDSFEIIVVDNGSTSFPSDICAAYGNVRLEEETTPGPGPARNKGVSASRGGVLAFIDADCIPDRDWLAAVNAAFLDDAVQIVGGDVRIALVDPAKPTMLEAYESVFAYRQQEYIERQGFSGAGNLAMRRAAFDTVGSFAGIDVAEDRDWGRRATRLGYSIRYIPHMIVFHPARETLAKLYEKWDRHISHDFVQPPRGAESKLGWAFRALAIGCSPIFEMRRIFTSGRVSSFRERCHAALVVARIRQYRMRKMLDLLLKRSRVDPAAPWNREL